MTGKRIIRKGGRPRKTDVARYLCGQIKQDIGPTPEALAKRAALVGEDKAMGKNAGRASRLLKEWGILSWRQAVAIEEYFTITTRYNRAIQLSVGGPRIARSSFLDFGGKSEECDDERLIEAKQKYASLQTVMQKCRYPHIAKGLLEMFAMENVCPEAWRTRNVGPIMIDVLKEITIAIADHFGVEKNEKVA